jgi:hypothetical protein
MMLRLVPMESLRSGALAHHALRKRSARSTRHITATSLATYATEGGFRLRLERLRRPSLPVCL